MTDSDSSPLRYQREGEKEYGSLSGCLAIFLNHYMMSRLRLEQVGYQFWQKTPVNFKLTSLWHSYAEDLGAAMKEHLLL